jgi:hypothetical protein
MTSLFSLSHHGISPTHLFTQKKSGTRFLQYYALPSLPKEKRKDNNNGLASVLPFLVLRAILFPHSVDLGRPSLSKV